MKPFFIFILSFIAPFIYWRSLFYLRRAYFNRPLIRTVTGLQIHHLHHGIIYVSIEAVILLFYGLNTYVLIFLGIGLGSMFDEFIWSAMMPGNRQLELDVYNKSFLPTLILFFVIIILLLILSVYAV